MLKRWQATLESVATDVVRLRGAASSQQPERIEELSARIGLAIEDLVADLEAATGEAAFSTRESVDAFPRSLLCSPANRELAAALEVAYEASDRVDEERGRPRDGVAHDILLILRRVGREIGELDDPG